MEKITFSVELGKLTKKDLKESAALSEAFFHMNSKPDEIPASKENLDFIYKIIPDCDNVIRDNGKAIGFTFIVPCSNEIMIAFLSGKITENELFNRIKKEVTYDNFETIYLCSSFLKEEYRGRGIASKARIMSIKKIIGKRKIHPILFVWPQTPEGKKSTQRVAKELGYTLKIKV